MKARSQLGFEFNSPVEGSSLMGLCWRQDAPTGGRDIWVSLGLWGVPVLVLSDTNSSTLPCETQGRVTFLAGEKEEGILEACGL